MTSTHSTDLDDVVMSYKNRIRSHIAHHIFKGTNAEMIALSGPTAEFLTDVDNYFILQYQGFAVYPWKRSLEDLDFGYDCVPEKCRFCKAYECKDRADCGQHSSATDNCLGFSSVFPFEGIDDICHMSIRAVDDFTDIVITSRKGAHKTYHLRGNKDRLTLSPCDCRYSDIHDRYFACNQDFECNQDADQDVSDDADTWNCNDYYDDNELFEACDPICILMLRELFAPELPWKNFKGYVETRGGLQWWSVPNIILD